MDRARTPRRIDTVADWSAIFRDGDVWYPVLRAVLQKHGLAGQWGRHDVWPGRVAGTHAVFVVGGRYVVKFYGPFWPHDHQQEVAVMRRLAGHPRLLGSVRLPELVAAGTVASVVEAAGGREWQYIIASYLPGRQLGEIWAGLAEEQRLRLAGDLGQALAELHTMKPDGLDGVGPEAAGPPGRRRRDAWVEFVASQARAALARQEAWGTLPTQLLADLPGFLERVRPLPREGWRPALLHCDVTAEHVLVDQPAGGGPWRLVGLIDFGDAMVGDPEYDLPVICLSALSGDRAAFRAFLSQYGHGGRLDDARLAQRMMAYALLHVFPVLREVPAQMRELVWSAPSLEAAAVVIWG